MPINGAMIARARRYAQQTFLTDTCTVKRSMTAKGDYMEDVESWSAIHEDLPCRLIRSRQPIGDGVEMSGQRQVLEDEYRLAVADDVDIDGNDRITIDGVEYGIVRMDDVMTDKFFKHVILTNRRGSV